LRNLKELPITDTELRLIAAAAQMGPIVKPSGANAPAATGTASTLYKNANTRFCRIVRRTARLSRRARTSPRRSGVTSVTAALSMAMSVPVPSATPTSALASAGASLMPSPAIATVRPSD